MWQRAFSSVAYGKPPGFRARGGTGGRGLDRGTGRGSEAPALPRLPADGHSRPALPDSLRPLPDYVGLVGDSGSVEIGFLPDCASMVALSDATATTGGCRRGGGLVGRCDSDARLDGGRAAPPMDAPPVQPATYSVGMRGLQRILEGETRRVQT